MSASERSTEGPSIEYAPSAICVPTSSTLRKMITAAVSAGIVGALASMGIVPSAGQVAAIVVVVKIAVMGTIALGAFWVSRRRRARQTKPLP